MTRLLKDTDIKERLTEHDLRGKVGNDEAGIDRATDLLGHASKEITKRHYRRKAEVIKPVRRPGSTRAKFEPTTLLGNARWHKEVAKPIVAIISGHNMPLKVLYGY